MDRPLIRYTLTAVLATVLAAAAPPSRAAERPVFSLAASAAAGDGDAGPAAVAFSLAANGPQGAPSGTLTIRPPVMEANYRRAIVQNSIFAVIATYHYWHSYHKWIEDWQFELTFADQAKRFLTTQAITFDSNAYITNWTHVTGGALYYQLARASYLSWPESLLTAFGASAFYEYVSEWREVISINDTFLTTFGGFAVGEPFFQLSDYLHHQKALPLRILGFMNPINEMDQWLDRKKPASRLYDAPGWANLVFSAGWLRSAETGRQAHDAALISFESQILRTPEYGKPGNLAKVQHDSSLSELEFSAILRQRSLSDADLRSGRNEEMDFYARVVGLSWYRQSIDELGRGSALSIGLGSALTYLRKRPVVYDARGTQVHIDPPPDTPTDFRDKMTVAHLFGPVLDWTRFGRGVKVRVVADAYADFAMMNAFAMNAYSASHAIEGMKTTLSYYGYYYGYGGSASARVDVDWGHLWVRGLVSGHAWGSWQGRDRYQSGITNNVAAADTRTRYLLKAGWRFGGSPVRIFGGVEGIHRGGRIADVRAASQETRTFAGLSYLF
jgi:hypothetical protein